jgi:hypothetical protein
MFQASWLPSRTKVTKIEEEEEGDPSRKGGTQESMEA